MLVLGEPVIVFLKKAVVLKKLAKENVLRLEDNALN